MTETPAVPAGDNAPAAPKREIRYEVTPGLADLLAEVGAGLMVSTYQAGKLVTVGNCQGKLEMGFHNFDRPMGVAISEAGDRLAVAGREQVWLLKNAADIAPRVEPQKKHDACYLTRLSYATGEIQSHEMAWGAGGELFVVNTLFSCLAKVDPAFSFVPVWKPKFISALAPEDRCHLNGMAMVAGKPRFVTAIAETDSERAWRADRVNTGVLIDVETSETIARGFAMPHSPRVYGGYVWLLDSGNGALVRVDPRDGTVETAARFPGFTRGLAIRDNLAFVGLSKIRETATFGGLPIADRKGELKCGVGVVDLLTGELRGQIEFVTGVEELFEVSLTPGVLNPLMRGPFAQQEGEQMIWLAPQIEAPKPAAD